MGTCRDCPAVRADALGFRCPRRDTGPGRGQHHDHQEGHGRGQPPRRRVPAARLRWPGSRTREDRCARDTGLPRPAPGVYRLKETASGSLLHEVAADQDVIVTPGATTRLTITDAFKAAKVLLQAKDDKTGKLLTGATVNIGSGDKTLLTLTTGAKGTASGELPVPSRKAEFWVKQIKAPRGYDLYKTVKTFAAGPAAPVTVTVTNAKTASTPKPDPSGKPADKPAPTPSTPEDKPTHDSSGGTSLAAPGSATPSADPSLPATAASDKTTPKAPKGSPRSHRSRRHTLASRRRRTPCRRR